MENSIKMVITVDWEGLSLEPQNLHRLSQFKRRWQMPWVHYMNPSYFTNQSLFKIATSTAYHNFFDTEEDEWGLHLHACRSVVEAAGVGFKATPSFSHQGDQYAGDFHGQEVMLHTYNSDELQQLLEFSKRILSKQGFEGLLSFRAGGWMMDSGKFQVLKRCGFRFDSSEASSFWLKESCWKSEPLKRYLDLLWGETRLDKQPYQVTKDFFEVPNNLGAIDYWNHLTEPLGLVTSGYDLGKRVWVVTLHQETADQYLDRLDEFLSMLRFSSLPIEFHTNQSLWQESQGFKALSRHQTVH